MIESCVDRCHSTARHATHIRHGILYLLIYTSITLATLMAIFIPIEAHVAPPDPTSRATALLHAALPEAWSLQRVVVKEDRVTVCINVPIATLLEGHGMGAEAVEQQVYASLVPMDWRVLHVQARDPETGECQPLSDFLPGQPISPGRAAAPKRYQSQRPLVNESKATRASPPPKVFPLGLEGKTVYISAGHGWRWGRDYSASSPLAWRTQRPVYEDFIEDHNNAEAVNQYLIPYLEQAGATVVPVRERDWNPVRVVVDNTDPTYSEAGRWLTGTVSGYANGIARVANTVTGTVNATATWVLNIPQTSLYALYAWVGAGENHAPDAHYTVHHAGGPTSLYLNQRIRPETWRYLGSFPCYAGPVTVTLDNHSTTTETVVMADALRFGSGAFESLTDIETTAPEPPNKPWWESATYYYSQWMGMDPSDWAYFNDIVARPMFARWYHTPGDDALYLSWHTNGYNGTARGTESYVHNGETYPRTEGSLDLQRAVHNELIHDIRMGWDADWIDRGQKLRNLGEIRMLWDADLAKHMPGMLLELGFHDHPDDAAALKNPRFNQLAARAIYQGIVHYFEARDETDLLELPEPPTHLRVQNLDGERSIRGGRSIRVAWSAPSTDTEQLRGDPATGYRVYTSTDAFAWHTPRFVTDTEIILPHLDLGETFYVQVTAVNAGGESFPTKVMGVRVGHPMLLIVNGFDKLDDTETPWENDPIEGWNQRMLIAQMNSDMYVVHHGDAVPPLYAWDSASREAVSDGLVSLDQYSIVDWILGEEGGNGQISALPLAARKVLQALLDNGGALLISGTNLAHDLADQDPTFLHQTLHTGYVTDDAGTYTVEPTAQGALAGLEEVRFDAPGEYDAHAPDVLTTTYGATATLTYIGGRGGVAGLQYAEGCSHRDGHLCGRTLVLGFPLEVVNPQVRETLMTHALDFLDACTFSQTMSIHSPQAGGVYSWTPAFEGLAYSINTALSPTITIQIARQSDGRFWNGTGWDTAIWLTATSTLTQTNVVLWHYDLPPLADDIYTLQAQAINTQGIRSNMEIVTFTLDTIPPPTPTLVTPMPGAIITTTEVHFTWHTPSNEENCASVRRPRSTAAHPANEKDSLLGEVSDQCPLSYHLNLDGTLHTLTRTTYTIPVTPTLHRWRVRAIDTARNVGPWSEVATFTVALPATAIITSPIAGGYYSRTPLFAGNAFGNDLIQVKVQILRERDLATWNGSSWQTSTWIGDYAWLTATTQTPITPLQTTRLHWAYPSMPPLEDGLYTVRAKGIAQTTSILPFPPDEVKFTYDHTQPLTPTLITPTGGITLSAGPVRMQWTTPPDNGAPLVYHLGVAYSSSAMTSGQAPTTTYTQTLNTPGLYRWRVQAVDAASNYGPWSHEAHFIIIPKYPTLYLPLITREASSDQHCWTTFEDGFEQNGWQYNRAVRVSEPLHNGNWAAQVGIPPGMPSSGEKTYASVYRTLTLPPDVSQITLQYWTYSVAEGNDADDRAYVSLKTETGQILELSLTPMSNAARWEMRAHDLSKFASSTLILNLGVINDGDDDTAALYLDDVRIQACR